MTEQLRDRFRNQLDLYQNGLQRYLVLSGGSPGGRVMTNRIEGCAIFVVASVFLLLMLGCCLKIRWALVGRGEEVRDDRCEPTGPAARWEPE